MSTSVSRVAAGGVLALLGLVVLKFIIGMFVAVTGIFMFFLVKVVPILLIGLIVMWLWKKFTRNNESPAS
jgi:archaellum biogenesis protein FlaJ (TadC family)